MHHPWNASIAFVVQWVIRAAHVVVVASEVVGQILARASRSMKDFHQNVLEVLA